MHTSEHLEPPTSEMPHQVASHWARISAGLAVTGLLGAGLLACDTAEPSGSIPPSATPSHISPPLPESSQTTQLPSSEESHPNTVKPNIIFFLLDDMDASQLRYMPNARKYIFDRGANFTNYYTDISLCCAARSSIFTGKYAKNTGVVGNKYPDGFIGFHRGDENKDTFAISLHNAGYLTALYGKYLNEYPDVESSPSHALPSTYIPKGWSEWNVPVNGQYRGENYVLNHNGNLEHHDTTRDYLGDLTERRLLRLIHRNKDKQGLMAEFSSYAPHVPEPTSPIEKSKAALVEQVNKIQHPRTPDFNEQDVSDKPHAMSKLPPLTNRTIQIMDATYRREILADKSVDRYIGDVYEELARTNQLNNTYMVFASDNGYHMGTHRLPIGKNTAYDTDIKLPFGIAGPGITAGTQVTAITSNIDLAPTFTDIAGLSASSTYDGRSLLPLAMGEEVPTDWRKNFLVERGYVTAYGAIDSGEEPGAPGESKTELAMSGYWAVVADGWRYIDNHTGDDELYHTKVDPYELHNLLADPASKKSPEVQNELQKLRIAEGKLIACDGTAQCDVQ